MEPTKTDWMSLGRTVLGDTTIIAAIELRTREVWTLVTVADRGVVITPSGTHIQLRPEQSNGAVIQFIEWVNRSF